MKRQRQEEILKIIDEKAIGTHEELIDELKRRGINVTQATVSRDIKELRLVKVPSRDGSVYAHAKNGSGADNTMFADSVKSVKCALHTIVIKTQPGMAGGVGAAVDGALGADMLGTIAGDDTVLVIAQSETAAEQLRVSINNFFKIMGE